MREYKSTVISITYGYKKIRVMGSCSNTQYHRFRGKKRVRHDKLSVYCNNFGEEDQMKNRDPAYSTLRHTGFFRNNLKKPAW